MKSSDATTCGVLFAFWSLLLLCLCFGFTSVLVFGLVVWQNREIVFSCISFPLVLGMWFLQLWEESREPFDSPVPIMPRTGTGPERQGRSTARKSKLCCDITVRSLVALSTMSSWHPTTGWNRTPSLHTPCLLSVSSVSDWLQQKLVLFPRKLEFPSLYDEIEVSHSWCHVCDKPWCCTVSYIGKPNI